MIALIAPVATAGKGDGIVEPDEDETEELARAVQDPDVSGRVALQLLFPKRTDQG